VFALCLPLSVAAATVSYFAIERPIRRFAMRFGHS
jgi:peptidoglycan/LPS O-acetylase OafA/YrhL